MFGPSESTEGIVLAGTYHWREPWFAARTPRVLMPVAQTPLIYYALRWLKSSRITRATICANSATTAVRERVGGGSVFGMQIGYFEDENPRGAAGCIRDAATKTDATTLVIVDGTAIPTIDIDDLLEYHKKSSASVTVAVHSTQGLNGENALRPLGVYLVDRSAVKEIPEVGFQDIKERLIPRLHRAGLSVMARHVSGDCPRVLTTSTYLSVNFWMVKRSATPGSCRAEELAEYTHHNEALIHPSAKVAKNATVIGPAIVGPNVRVESGAVLVGPSVIGPDVNIGADAVVSRSVLWRGCEIEGGAHVDECVLPDDCIVKSGSAVIGLAAGAKASVKDAPRGRNGSISLVKSSSLTARLRNIRTRAARYGWT